MMISGYKGGYKLLIIGGLSGCHNFMMISGYQADCLDLLIIAGYQGDGYQANCHELMILDYFQGKVVFKHLPLMTINIKVIRLTHLI